MPTAKAVRLGSVANREWPKGLGLVCCRPPAVQPVAFCDSGAFRDTSLDAAMPWQTSSSVRHPCSNANRCGGRCGMNRGVHELRSLDTGAMINRQRLAMWIVVVALSLPAYADRASDAYNHGVRAERQQNYDGAYEYYKQAHTAAPNDGKYLAAYMRTRFNAAMRGRSCSVRPT